MRKNEAPHSASVRRDDEQTVPLAIAQSLSTLAIVDWAGRCQAAKCLCMSLVGDR